MGAFWGEWGHLGAFVFENPPGKTPVISRLSEIFGGMGVFSIKI